MAPERPAVPEPTANYPGHRHEDMKRLVEENYDPEQVAAIADTWKNIGRDLTDLAVGFNILVNGSQGGWTGSAAEGARAALGKVGTFADTTGDQFTATGDAVRAQGTVASEAKTKMPPPVEYDPKKMFTEALGSGSLLQLGALAFTMPAQKAKSDGAKDEAVTVMRNRDDAMRSATTSMPAFAEIPTVTQEQGTTTPSSQTSSVNTSTINPNTTFGTTGMPGMPAGNDGTTSTSWTAPPSTPPARPSVTPPLNQPPGSINQPPIGPPGMVPPRVPGQRPPGQLPPLSPRDPRTGRPLPTGGGSTGRGTGGGMGTPGRPGFGPTGSGQGGPALGRGPAGGFGPTGSGPAPDMSGRGAAARGAAGAASGGGTGAGGGKGEGGEDQEHQSKYLVPTDEHFNDQRMVAPPVIGE